jgi:sialidase-1
MRIGEIIRLLLACCGMLASFAGEVDLFEAGVGGYHTYRIPALVVATNGTVLAFCEGRMNGAADSGRIDLLLKRSMDGGKTWLPQTVLRSDGDNVCGNPAAVVDQITGAVFLLTTWNLGSDTEKAILDGRSADARRVFVMESRDCGVGRARRRLAPTLRKPIGGGMRQGRGTAFS